MTESRPTLLVFTRAPETECARRRLLPARLADGARALFERSLAAALEAGRESDCQIEVSSPHTLSVIPGAGAVPQRGRTFGERFRNAFADARGRARGALVAVGSDVPGLSGRHVRAALERLGARRDRVVVGPSPDGGFYLLASHRPLDAELGRVRWCTRHALDSLLAALRESGLEVRLLEPLRDLDRPQDLRAWVAHEARGASPWRDLADQLRALLAELCRPLTPALAIPVRGLDRAALPSRAPPR